MNAQVVTCSSRQPRPFEDYYRPDKFYASLRRFAEVPFNLAAGREHEFCGLMSKPFFLRQWLRAGNNTSDRLIVCDAWDVIFTQHPHGIGDQCAELFGDTIVFNGEQHLFPPKPEDEECYPDDGSPWRFLNSGFMCGPSDKILALLEAMPIEEVGFDRRAADGSHICPNDQEEYQKLFAKKARAKYYVQDGFDLPDMVIDTQCRLAVTLHDWPLDTFDFTGEPAQWKNLKTGTTPGVWHGNGNGKNYILPVIIEKMGL